MLGCVVLERASKLELFDFCRLWSCYFLVLFGKVLVFNILIEILFVGYITKDIKYNRFYMFLLSLVVSSLNIVLCGFR